tara:strand:- start:523 stop:738 length:216 start_codon:yes stop_codon:yes gene_type:complete
MMVIIAAAKDVPILYALGRLDKKLMKYKPMQKASKADQRMYHITFGWMLVKYFLFASSLEFIKKTCEIRFE